MKNENTSPSIIPLTDDEKAEFAKLEGQIEAQVAIIKPSIETAGMALSRIQETQYYRETHATFSDYCKARWNWTRNYAYRMINANEIKQGLNCALATNLTTEAQARALGKVPKRRRNKVIEIASAAAQADGRPMTSTDIKEAAGIAPIPVPTPPQTGPLSFSRFQEALDALCDRIPDDSDHMRYANILTSAAAKQANWGSDPNRINPYAAYH